MIDSLMRSGLFKRVWTMILINRVKNDFPVQTEIYKLWIKEKI